MSYSDEGLRAIWWDGHSFERQRAPSRLHTSGCIPERPREEVEEAAAAAAADNDYSMR